MHNSVHFWIKLELEEIRRQQAQSLNISLFLSTDEIVPNVLCVTVRQYQMHNHLTQPTRDQLCLPSVMGVPLPQMILIIF